MNLGVLLLTCQEGRGTTFTRAWTEQAIGRVADYFFAQSGGRETITFKVFDWIQLTQTEAEWSGLGMGAYSTLKPSLENTIGESLDPFTHVLIGIDHSMSSGGTTPGALTYLAASNFTPSFIAHELGHRYGADDAFRETPTGPQIYQNNFCVMGAEGWPYVFADPVLADPTAPMLNGSGPGMSAPTLMGTKWLNEDQHGLGCELSDNNLFSSGGAMVELSALAGAPGPNWNRPPVVIRYRDLVIEYRVRASDGWDRGLAEPGDGAGGWVVVHRSERGAPRAVYVNSVAARPGVVLLLGKDDPRDLFNPGPVKISVLSFDANARTVRLHLGRRAARELPSGTTYGGVDVGGGGLVWTPGRGFTKVPPHSPLIKVLDEVVRIQALQELMALASRNELEALAHEAAQVMQGLRESVSGVQVQPSVSPLAHALENISQLHTTSQSIGPDGGDGAAQRFIESSQQQLAGVKQILARAVEEERRL
jgi:hypothetical protein